MIVNHIGIYGICIKDNRLLCIRKEKGPYRNRFDLPGGSQKENEGLTETLVREFKEETNRTVHHIMVFYDVDVNFEQQDEVLEKLVDELNDSSGIYWIDLEKLDISNASPVILKLVQELSNDEAILEKVVYNNWKIL